MHVLHVHTDIQLIPLLARYAVGVPPIAVLANKMLQITGPKILQNVFSYSALQDCSTIVFICKILIFKVAISPVTSMVLYAEYTDMRRWFVTQVALGIMRYVTSLPPS